ncbi:hypothetical protein J6590_042832 [Homalodisca vitripennis]|nr:hypothetical protein J6590_042832 [Homalodisca vitripennis]
MTAVVALHAVCRDWWRDCPHSLMELFLPNYPRFWMVARSLPRSARDAPPRPAPTIALHLRVTYFSPENGEIVETGLSLPGLHHNGMYYGRMHQRYHSITSHQHQHQHHCQMSHVTTNCTNKAVIGLISHY